MLPEDVRIQDWEHFVQIAGKITPSKPSGPTIFRGQANSDWELEPSLLRLLNEMEVRDVEKAHQIENLALLEFQKHAPRHSKKCKQLNKNNLLFWWEMMQHYNAPTRLLDWTHSPYVALYFAVSECLLVDGVLFTMDAAHLAWIQSTRRGRPGFENKDAFMHLENSLRGENYEKSMGVISCPEPTDRMLSQKSEFTFSTELLESHNTTADAIVYGRAVGGEGHTIFKKYIVPAERKLEMQNRLYSMDITANSLFPGLDGLGRSVRDYLLLTSNVS